MSRASLRGVIAAIPTPITAGGEPDIARFLQHARWALSNGCDALNVLGTPVKPIPFPPINEGW